MCCRSADRCSVTRALATVFLPGDLRSSHLACRELGALPKGSCACNSSDSHDAVGRRNFIKSRCLNPSKVSAYDSTASCAADKSFSYRACSVATRVISTGEKMDPVKRTAASFTLMFCHASLRAFHPLPIEIAAGNVLERSLFERNAPSSRLARLPRLSETRRLIKTRRDRMKN